MPGAGTDKTKRWVVQPGPVIVLVEPQMGENIGAVARAMANFGLAKLRLVKPVQGWPNERARVMAAGADRVLDDAQLYDSLADAIADCSYAIATTARQHDQNKPVIGAEEAARKLTPHIAAGETVAMVFGRERNGLENDEVGQADAILTLPVNPAFASLNLGQAVLVCAYEWFKLSTGGELPFEQPDHSPPAGQQQMQSFFADLERELDAVEFFRPEEKRGTMRTNLRNIFIRMTPTTQDMRTLHGIITAIAHGRKGPARGGVLDGVQAQQLREIVNREEDKAAQTPVRGLSRLLRRNPTDAERVLWNALVNDKRFAGKGFKRQTPVGRYIADFVSFPLRTVIDLVPAQEDQAARDRRVDKRLWFIDHDYRVIEALAVEVERDLPKVLEILSAGIAGDPSVSES